MGLLDVLKSAGTPAPVPASLVPLDDQRTALTVYEQRISGKSYLELSDEFDVPILQIKEWCDQARQIYRQILASQTGFDCIVDAMAELDYLRSRALGEVQEMAESYVEEGPDGKKIKIKGFSHAANANYMRTAVDLLKNKTEMQMRIGAMPTQPEKIHHTITGHKEVEDSAESIDKDERTIDEIQADIIKKLAHTNLLGDDREEGEEDGEVVDVNDTPPPGDQAEEISAGGE